MFGAGDCKLQTSDILNSVRESDILSYYLNIQSIPCIINSPLRKDERPSFGLYSIDGNKIHFRDLSTGDRGGTFDLLMKLWGTNLKGVIKRINKDISNFKTNIKVERSYYRDVMGDVHTNSNIDIKCKVRDWEPHDIEYWNSFGITVRWLEYAEIYPISHKIIVKDGKTFTFKADRYAYAYVEHKDNKVTLKIYQPFNDKGYKWCNKHDTSVISLWTKVPERGNIICICASMKDALCLWENTGIPSIAIQGEGYRISDTAVNELKRRFKHIAILLDNDKAGLLDGKRLSEETGFTNLILPETGAKDISDLYKLLNNKYKFKTIIKELFQFINN